MIEPELQTYKNWTFRFSVNKANPVRLLVILHGWMGDENSMWVLTQKLSSQYAILAPRAPFPVPEGGYSWREIRPGTWGMATLEDLRPAAEALLMFVDDWSKIAKINAVQFDLMGFSQGAAMTYTLALLYPARLRRLAALSGFIPEKSEAVLTSQRLSGKPIFVAHGRKDDLIPMEQARKAVELLTKSGAQIKYCESDTGHKASKECLREMQLFLEEV